MNTRTPDPTDPRDRSVDVLGLGNMGLGIAVVLRDAGWKVTGFDPSPKAREAADEHRVAHASSMSDLKGAWAVLSLPSASTVEEVVPRLLAASPERIVIDATTSELDTSRRMHELTAVAGGAFVDAPVSGGRAGAWSGTLTSFVGGTQEAVTAAAPLLDVIAPSWTHLGGPGSGNVVKVLNNLLCAANLATVAEAIDVLAAHRLDVPKALHALNTGSGRSAVSQTVFEDGILRGKLSGGFAVGLMSRDVSLGMAVARAAGADPVVLSAVARAWEHALTTLGPAADCNLAPSAFTTATTILDPARLRQSARSGTADENEESVK